jgi:hypothetical protein
MIESKTAKGMLVDADVHFVNTVHCRTHEELKGLIDLFKRWTQISSVNLVTSSLPRLRLQRKLLESEILRLFVVRLISRESPHTPYNSFRQRYR